MNLSAVARRAPLGRCAAFVFGALIATNAVWAQAPAAPANAAARQGAQRNGQTPAAGSAGATAEGTLPIPPETSSVTKHDLTMAGRTIHYTATAGNLLVKNEQDKPIGSIFYVAYTEDGVEPGSRPVTFCYNGGPGSATVWLHMGSIGPVRVVTDSPGATAPAPFKYVPNQYSMLDKTDLVFIDAPLSGFSRAVGTGTARDFSGTDPDVAAFDKFITRYVTVNERWNSPKFLFGESYGTTRSGALVAALQSDGMEMTGVTFLSSILNYNIRVPGYDIEDIGTIPSYAAIAYQHNKAKKVGSLQETVQKAREWAWGPYAAALAKGDNISPAEFNAVAEKMAAITGLSVQYVKQSKLRVSATHYRKELLRDDDKIMGRYDARFLGWDTTDEGENPGYDPSDTGISGVFVGAFHEYLVKDLKYMSQEQYYLSAPGVNNGWSFAHRGAGGRGGGGGTSAADVVFDISTAMRQNPKLQIFSANGWFDLATPFGITEYDLAHLGLPAELHKNVHFGYYPAGHMVYLNVDALKEMKGDLDKFYSGTAK